MGLLFNNLEFVLKYDLVGLSLLEHQGIAVDVCREHLVISVLCYNNPDLRIDNSRHGMNHVLWYI